MLKQKNLGCESQFAKFDNRLKVSGGSTSVPTLSRKDIEATNAYLVDSKYVEMGQGDKQGK